MVSYIWQWKIIQELGPAAEEKQKGKGGSVLQVFILVVDILARTCLSEMTA
jgi:hypothetical protein